LEKLELLVVADPHPTTWAVVGERKNDTYLLPICTQFESKGCRTASNRSLQWYERVVAPIFESKDDYEVMYLLAKKLGFADQMFKNIKVVNNVPEAEDILREINRGGFSTGYCGQSPERLKAHMRNQDKFDLVSLRAPKETPEVGGDYYDFLDLGQQRLGLVAGDISGKGIAAALLMANLQANLRSQCAIALDQPQRFLQSVNRLFYENSTDSAYATLFFAEYDDRVRRLRYVNCGHLAALLLRQDGSLEKLDSTCTVLGLFKQWECSTGERLLSSGDTLAIYTDGIPESFNDAGEQFGEPCLIESLRRHRDQPSPVLVAAIVDDVKNFSPREQSDDITLIIAKCR
jgi:hypothetical protein